MRLPSISHDAANTVWIARAQGMQPDTTSIQILPIDGGDDDFSIFSVMDLDEFIGSLSEIRSKFSNPDGAFAGKSAEVDSLVVEPIHVAMSGKANPFQLSQLGFWRWLSNSAHQDIWAFIDWRFKRGDEFGQKVNWGVTSSSALHEVYFYRAWIRAHKMYDPNLSDPYRYAKIGSSDNWRSHILRVEPGYDREFVKAFLDIVEEKKINADEMRNVVIPSLRAWSSNAGFFALDYESAKKLIGHLIGRGVQ
jgi:hypothetical protein